MNMRSYDCCSLSSPAVKNTLSLAALLKLLSDNNRLRILCILKNGEHCVCELMAHVKLSQSLISHHLKDLKDNDLVAGRRDSKWSYYSLTSKGIQVTDLIFKLKI